MERDDERTQLAYAHALAHWGDVGGYDAEVLWDTVTVAALGVPYDGCKYRELTTLSGGEQKRLALELLLRGPDEVLLLDEPDNYLDVPGKRWLEQRLRETSKTVLFVSHDRELLANVADRIVTVEGGTTWVHGGGFASYHEARAAKHERMAEVRRRWEEEHARLKELVRTLQQQAKISEAHGAEVPRACCAARALRGGRAAAGQAREREAGHDAPARWAHRRARRHLRAARTHRADARRSTPRSSTASGSACSARTAPASRTSCACSAASRSPHAASWRLGARVVPGLFAQTHTHAAVARTARSSTCSGRARPGAAVSTAAGRWARCAATGCSQQGDQTFGTLSGGQQARFQILLLELSGATLLLLDEPTDNLDVLSAEALEEALEIFEGTVRRGHARPVVRPLAGPVPGLRGGRDGLRVGRAGLRRDPGGPSPLRRRGQAGTANATMLSR